MSLCRDPPCQEDAKKDIGGYCQYDGLFHGGGYYLLSIQSLMVLALTVWAAVITFIMLGVWQLFIFKLNLSLRWSNHFDEIF